jgi:uncharacterized protein
MMEDRAGHVARPLAGKTAWLITDGKAGMDVQVRGVAAALGLDAEVKHVAPSGAFKLFAPYGPVAAKERIGVAGGAFAAPWPDVVIATGRQSIPYLRAIRKKAGLGTYSIVLQDPKTGGRTADLVWVPAHDRLRGPNVVTTPTAPHPFTPERLAALRRTMPADIAALPGLRFAVILGGKNGIYKFTDACDDRLQASLASLAALGASFMITPSRRTHPRLMRKVDEATASAPRVLYSGDGPNPYPEFLAHADMLVVTADSVNMCGEAAATGKPVYVFTPSGGSPKFQRFHAALVAHGATRPLPARLERLESWDYPPLQAAEAIAREVERRYTARRVMILGT